MSKLDEVVDGLVEGLGIERDSYNQLLTTLEGMETNLKRWKGRTFEIGLIFQQKLSMEQRNKVVRLIQNASANLTQASQILQGVR